MSCLSECGCSESTPETDSLDDLAIIQGESSYQPLSETSYASEAIPLLLKDPTMVKYEADPYNYDQIAFIGTGFTGAASVYFTSYLPSGHHVALKRINLDLCYEDLTYIQKDIIVNRQIRHENILPYLCSFVYCNEVWTVMPVMGFGSAKSVTKAHFPYGLPEAAISFILKDILSALDYIHKRGFIHRSIKASHILLSTSGRAVLTGFRYSCNVVDKGKWQSVIHTFPSDSTSNLNWLSPEVLEQNLMGYNFKSDVYSIGITTCELANGVVPYVNMPPTQMLLEKLDGEMPCPWDSRTFDIEKLNNFQSTCLNQSQLPGQVQENHRMPKNNYTTRTFTDVFHTFARLCLQRDPYLRPSSIQLLSHSFIKNSKKSQVSLLDILAIVTPLAEVLNPTNDEDKLTDISDQMRTIELDDSWNF